MIIACLIKGSGEVRSFEFPEGEWMPAWQLCDNSPLVERTFTGLTQKEVARDIIEYLDRRPNA